MCRASLQRAQQELAREEEEASEVEQKWPGGEWGARDEGTSGGRRGWKKDEEGTRSRSWEMLPFKDGAFRLAIESGAPILPIAVAGTRDAMAKGSFRFLPARAIAQLLEPIPTTGMTLADVSTLKQLTRERIEAGRRLLAAELGIRVGDDATTVPTA